MAASLMKTWKDVVGLLILVAVVAGFYLFYIKTHEPGPKIPEVGDEAPDFTLPALKGASVRLNDYRGKVVLLNFWATWCPPCREEMPSMQSLYERLKAHPFEILAVSIDTQGETVVRPFVEEYGLTFPILLDTGNTMTKRYALTGVPETFIIDKDGTIAMKIIGPQDWLLEEWGVYFDRLIGKD